MNSLTAFNEVLSVSSLICCVSLDGHECKLKPDWFAEAKKRDAVILVSFDFSVW